MAPVLVDVPKAPFDGGIRIAAVFPSLGRYGQSGTQSMNGARLAAEEVNRAGGVHGRRLELLGYRTGSYFVDAAEAARLAARAGAVALVGANSSSLSMAIAEVAESQELVQVSNVSTAQDLTWDPDTGEERPFVFRMCSSDVVMGRLLARFARETLDARRVALLYEVGRTYSAKLARSFLEAFRSPGHETREFFYLPLETDFRPQLRAVRGFAPDVLFVPGSFTDATLIAVQAGKLGLTPTLLGADSWSSPLLFERGGPSRPAYYCDLCRTPETFARRYAAAYGEAPQGCRAALAHDAVLALADALVSLGPLDDESLQGSLDETRRRLRAALARVSTRGATGPIRFDAHGDGGGRVAVMRVARSAGGAYVFRFESWLGSVGP